MAHLGSRTTVDRTARVATQVTALVSLAISVAIVVILFVRGLGFLTHVPFASLFADGWFPRRGEFSIPTILVGSLLVTAIAMIVAGPLGLGAAIYLSEYAPPGVRKTLKPVMEILAGIPSVVIGYFALSWITPNVVQTIWAEATPLNIAAAGLGVGILTIPIVTSICEDALKATPQELRDASCGLGARKSTTTVRVVVPAATSGVMGALIVAVSRAIGETMVVAIAMGASGGALFTLDIAKNGQTMTAAMISLATGSDQVKGATSAFESLFFVGLILFLITLVLNSISERFVRRVRSKH